MKKISHGKIWGRSENSFRKSWLRAQRSRSQNRPSKWRVLGQSQDLHGHAWLTLSLVTATPPHPQHFTHTPISLGFLPRQRSACAGIWPRSLISAGSTYISMTAAYKSCFPLTYIEDGTTTHKLDVSNWQEVRAHQWPAHYLSSKA